MAPRSYALGMPQRERSFLWVLCDSRGGRAKSPAGAAGGGFPRRISNLRVLPPGIMLTLTAPRMRRKGTPLDNLPSAALWTGEEALHPSLCGGFAIFLTNRGSSPPHSQCLTTKNMMNTTTTASTTSRIASTGKGIYLSPY
jgi:hypothetical protein